jgi:branched-chain amino acid transport system permease protein
MKRSLVSSGWLVIPLVGVVTLVVVSSASSANLFIYNSFLLASLGAIALNVLVGTAGQVSIANPALLAIGAFVTIAVQRMGWQFPFDVVVGALAAGAIGVVIGVPSVRLKGIYLALAGLAGLYIVVYFAQIYQVHTVGQAGFQVPLVFVQNGLGQMQVYWSWFLFAIVAATVAFFILLTQGRAGRAWRMIRDNELVASAQGIPVTRYKLVLFFITSVVVGAQGGLTAHYAGFVTSDNYTLDMAISYLAMIFIGGLDSILGSIIGAALVTWLPIVMPAILGAFSSSQLLSTDGPQFGEIGYGVLIVVFVMCSPNGVVGLLRRFIGPDKTRGFQSRVAERISDLTGRNEKASSRAQEEVASGPTQSQSNK